MDGTLAQRIVWMAPVGRPAKPRRDQPSSSERPGPALSTQSVRDLVLLLAGLAGLFHQFVLTPPGQASAVLVGAALTLIFGPIPLRLDERRKNGSKGS